MKPGDTNTVYYIAGPNWSYLVDPASGEVFSYPTLDEAEKGQEDAREICDVPIKKQHIVKETSKIII